MWEQQKANRSRADEEIATGRSLLRSANPRAFRVANTPVAPGCVIAKASLVYYFSFYTADRGRSLTPPLTTWHVGAVERQSDGTRNPRAQGPVLSVRRRYHSGQPCLVVRQKLAMLIIHPACPVPFLLSAHLASGVLTVSWRGRLVGFLGILLWPLRPVVPDIVCWLLSYYQARAPSLLKGACLDVPKDRTSAFKEPCSA